MLETNLTYLTDPALEANAVVVRTQLNEDGTLSVVTDHTIFYPQGGGQPCDMGTMSTAKGALLITQVKMDNGEVLHTGVSDKDIFTEDEEVNLKVDAARRLLHCRLHTAGHLVDAAMANLGYALKPGRGYHFADGSYVEYEGIIEAEHRNELKKLLTDELNRLAAAALDVSGRFYQPAELADVCMHMPGYIPDSGNVRVVFIDGKYGCACGGTHVSNTSTLQQMEVYKIKCKNGCTRISYKLVSPHA